jgi:hypothetical protein
LIYARGLPLSRFETEEAAIKGGIQCKEDFHAVCIYVIVESYEKNLKCGKLSNISFVKK